MFVWCRAASRSPDTNGRRPMRVGPSTTPARISPTTLGCRSLMKRYPSNCAVPTRSKRMKRIDVRSELDTDLDFLLPEMPGNHKGLLAQGRSAQLKHLRGAGHNEPQSPM